MWASGYYGFLSDYLWWWIVFVALCVNAWGFLRLTRGWSAKTLRVVIGNVLVSGAMMVLVGLVPESYLRFVSVATDPHGVTLTHQRWRAAFAPVNSLAYRDKEWSEGDPPGIRRMAVVGDSFTYGWGIDDPADRFTELLQDRFDKRTPGTVEVMNVAWAGWGTKEQIPAVRFLIELYGVDEVVLCHLPNDLQDSLPSLSGRDLTKPPRPTWFRPESSFLFDYLYYRVYVPWSCGGAEYFDWLADGYSQAETWAAHTTLLGSLQELCAAHGVTFRVALVPFLRVAGARFDQHRIHEQLSQFWRGRGVPVVDLAGVLAGKDPAKLVVRRDDPHPNEAAHGLFAQAIWDAYYAKP